MRSAAPCESAPGPVDTRPDPGPQPAVDHSLAGSDTQEAGPCLNRSAPQRCLWWTVSSNLPALMFCIGSELLTSPPVA